MLLPASNPEGLIMKNSLIGSLIVWMVGVWSAPALASGLHEQIIRLQPGWNAVYLDVQPEIADADRVFSGIPVQSAWAWDRPGQGVQFVDDPNKLAPGKPEWLTYYPPGSANAALKNLYEIEGGRALLVQVATNRAVDWRVVGAPARWRARWVDNALNLVGFPLAPSSTNTFRTLLGGDPAFSGSLTVLKLGTGGAWSAVPNPDLERVEPGRAYWVYCSGASSYGGPLEVATDQGARMDFGTSGIFNTLRLWNSGAGRRSYAIESEAGFPDSRVSGEVPLRFKRVTVDSEGHPVIAWLPFTNRLEVTLEAGQSEVISFEPLRNEARPTSPTNTLTFASLLSVRESGGLRTLMPISMQVVPRGGAASPRRLAGLAGDVTVPNPRAGLWVGNVTLTAVNFTGHPTDKESLRPTRDPFDFRIILHVGNRGDVRLLQRAMLMWKSTNDVGQGRYVVATDEELAARSGWTGVGLRSGQDATRRFSAPAFGFSGTRPMMMTNGSMGLGTLSCSVFMGFDDSLNPFKHMYHPDHDNLAPKVDPTTGAIKYSRPIESYEFTRNIFLEFTAKTPVGPGQQVVGPDLPGYGDTRLGGVYREDILDLQNRPIRLGGVFTVQRVVSVGVLNDGE